MSSELTVSIDGINQPYWDGLREGVLKYQGCACGHRWLPPRNICPSCLGSDWQWIISSGVGTIKSWVVYHVAYHAEFKEKLPYNVAIVHLQEGPQLISNIIDSNERLKIGAEVALCIDRNLEQPLARFKLVN